MEAPIAFALGGQHAIKSALNHHRRYREYLDGYIGTLNSDEIERFGRGIIELAKQYPLTVRQMLKLGIELEARGTEQEITQFIKATADRIMQNRRIGLPDHFLVSPMPARSGRNNR